ncbi:MAG: DUF3306 domain-containing protein [Paracoccaceae bacterium]
MSDADGFLGRWSRLKRGREAARPEPAAPEVETPTAVPEPAPERTEAEILDELGLPAPESLGAGDDFAAFMRAGVPDWLRRRALRRLWLTNPALANLDELVDYGEDFTDAATVVENLQTAWKVGRGYARDDEAEAEAPEAGEETPGDEAPAADAPPPEAVEADGAPAPEQTSVPAETAEPEGRTSPGDPGRPAPRPPVRARMRFSLPEGERGAG